MNEMGRDPLFLRSRMITCFMPDDGTDRELIRSLRDEKGILTADSKRCRSVGMLRPTRTKPGQLPESELARIVEIIVPDSEAAELFSWIQDVAQIGRPGGGVIFMGKTISSTRYELPEEISI